MGDLISRQAAIDALRYAQHRFTVADEAGGMGTVKWSENVIYFAAAERVLAELPSADRPQGEWEERPSEDWISIRRWYCSECGEWQTYGMTNYCPNCGAKMKGADDGEQIILYRGQRRPRWCPRNIQGKHADFMMIDEAVERSRR